MTISSTTYRNQYTGNGSNTVFAYTFKIFDQDDVAVLLNGVLQTITTHYTVSGVGSGSGGNITFLTAPSNGVVVTIRRNEPLTQEIDYVENDDFPAVAHEEGLDRSAIRDQFLQEQVDRCPKLVDGSTTASATFADPAGNAGRFVRVNSTANGFEYLDVLTSGSLAVSPYMQTVLDDTTAAAARTTLGLDVLTPPFFDTTVILKGSSDSTKQVMFEVDGLTTGTTRTITVPDKNGTMAMISDIGGTSAQDFRLSLTSGTPVTTTDVTGATIVYAVPYKGNSISLYNGTTWNVRTSAQFSLALGTLISGRPYDVFCFDNAGTPTLEFTAWTNDTTRATALAYQDGVLVRSGAATRRYMGTFYTTSTTTTEDSLAKRNLFNYYHRIARPMRRLESTTSWNYTTDTFRQANAAAANQLEFMYGVAEDTIDIRVDAAAANAGGSAPTVVVGIGIDSTTTNSATTTGSVQAITGNANGVDVQATYNALPSVGRHTAVWLERSTATGTTTWYGANNNGVYGITGIILA